MNKLIALLILGLNCGTISAATPQWTKFYEDEYGWSYIDKKTIKPLDSAPHIFEIDYKNVYRYGVPSIDIQAKGYIQAVHRIDCRNKAKAYVKSQRFTPQGKAIDKDGTSPYPDYFEPMSMDTPENVKLLEVVCKR